MTLWSQRRDFTHLPCGCRYGFADGVAHAFLYARHALVVCLALCSSHGAFQLCSVHSMRRRHGSAAEASSGLSTLCALACGYKSLARGLYNKGLATRGSAGASYRSSSHTMQFLTWRCRKASSPMCLRWTSSSSSWPRRSCLGRADDGCDASIPQ